MKVLSDVTQWRIVVGTPSFIASIVCDVPEKGYPSGPVRIALSTNLDVTSLSINDAKGIGKVLEGAVRYATRISEVAVAPESSLTYGRRAFSRRTRGLCRIVSNRDGSVTALSDSGDEERGSVLDFIPYVEESDV